MIVMSKAKVTTNVYRRNVAVALIAIFYSIYALLASGLQAAMGGVLTMMFGYLLYGFIAFRFVDPDDGMEKVSTGGTN